MNNIRNFIDRKKIIIALVGLLLVVFGIATMVWINNTYEDTIQKYENSKDNVVICEQCLETFNRIRFYKNSSNYVVQIKRNIIENYCKTNRFEDAKNFLNRYYEKSLDDMYGSISEAEKKNEEQQAELLTVKNNESGDDFNETEGDNTEGIVNSQNSLDLNGIGGCESGQEVIESLKGLNKSSYQSIGYILPIWNRNEEYYNSMCKCVMQGIDYDYAYSSEICGLIDYSILTPQISTIEYEEYLKYMYNRTDIVQDTNTFECVMVAGSLDDSQCVYNYIVTFKTQDRWFFGGVLKNGMSDFQNIIP